MAGWSTHAGQAVVLPLENVDTDQIIPARFMSVPRTEGYGTYLLHDLRREGNGSLDPDFPLNQNPTASVLIAGANFGSGSSREAAVYALLDGGFRVIIAPSFGDIFASNAVNNGVLPAVVAAQTHATLMAQTTAQAHIDLETQEITMGEVTAPFALEDSWRAKLMNGWDDIDLTQQHLSKITAFKETYSQTAAWAWPAAGD